MISGWALIVGGLLVAALVATIAALALAARHSRRGDDPTTLVRATQIVGYVWAGASAIGAVVSLCAILLTPQVTITMPIQQFWPQLPAGVVIDGGTATRAAGGFESVTLTLDGLSVGARVTWAISEMLGWVISGALAALVAVACGSMRSGNAFAPVVARTASVAAVIVAGGGIVREILRGISGSMASAETFESTGGSWTDIPGIESPFEAWIPQSTFLVEIPFWPIAAGLALAALAAIFRYGSRLQRDTEGLV
ncbi:hypothetical protein [Microbacterium sp.]|uniref:hypothetical protein n=1 Tax=Microbacterium sp. TaxID=51671 RepID=UPI003735E1A7